jgi:opacity protein-like surface antigen
MSPPAQSVPAGGTGDRLGGRGARLPRIRHGEGDAAGWASRLLGIVALATGLAAGATPALAQEPPAPSHPVQQASPPGHEADHGEHFHRNELALIVAATYEEGEHEEEGETFFTVGGEYERRLTRALGVGVEFEYVADAEAWLLLAPITLHPAGGLKLFGGLGLERKVVHESEHGEHHGDARDERDRETLFLWRIGAGYGFEFAERYSLGPTVSFDFIRESGSWVNAVVYGVTFGIGF